MQGQIGVRTNKRAQEGQGQGSRMPVEARLCRWWPVEPVPWKSRCATLNHFSSNYSGADSCNCCLSFLAICDASIYAHQRLGSEGHRRAWRSNRSVCRCANLVFFDRSMFDFDRHPGQQIIQKVKQKALPVPLAYTRQDANEPTLRHKGYTYACHSAKKGGS